MPPMIPTGITDSITGIVASRFRRPFGSANHSSEKHAEIRIAPMTANIAVRPFCSPSHIKTGHWTGRGPVGTRQPFPPSTCCQCTSIVDGYLKMPARINANPMARPATIPTGITVCRTGAASNLCSRPSLGRKNHSSAADPQNRIAPNAVHIAVFPSPRAHTISTESEWQ